MHFGFSKKPVRKQDSAAPESGVVTMGRLRFYAMVVASAVHPRDDGRVVAWIKPKHP